MLWTPEQDEWACIVSEMHGWSLGWYINANTNGRHSYRKAAYMDGAMHHHLMRYVSRNRAVIHSTMGVLRKARDVMVKMDRNGAPFHALLHHFDILDASVENREYMWSRYFPIFAIITGNDEHHMRHGLADILDAHNPYDSISILHMKDFYSHMRKSCIDMSKGAITPVVMESVMDNLLPEPYGRHMPIMTFHDGESIDFAESIIMQFMVMNMMSDGTSFDDAIKDIHTFLDTTRTGGYVLGKGLCSMHVLGLSPFAIRGIINDERIDGSIHDLMFNRCLYDNHPSMDFGHEAMDEYVRSCMDSMRIEPDDLTTTMDMLENQGRFGDIIEDQKSDLVFLAQRELSRSVRHVQSAWLIYRVLCQYDDDDRRIIMNRNGVHDVVNAYNEGLPVDFIANAWFEKVDEAEGERGHTISSWLG
jgi:hypothetical protein